MEKQPSEINEKELRAQQAEKIVDFLTRICAREYAEKLILNTETKKEFVFEDFKNFLIRINGIARGIPIPERKFDGERVYLSGFDEALVPNHKDKEKILEKAFSVLGKLKNIGDEKYLLPATVNAVHLFVDGNGRTSRILHTLLTKSESEDDFIKNLRATVGEEGRSETANINPGIIHVDIEKIVLTKHDILFKNDGKYSPVFPEGFGLLFASSEQPTVPKAKEFMALRRIDQPYCFVSAYEYLKEKDILSKVTMEIPSGLTISPLKMEQELSETDWDEIIKKYYELKKEEVDVLIEAFVEPDSYKNLDGSMNLRDYFLTKINKRLEENKKPHAR